MALRGSDRLGIKEVEMVYDARQIDAVFDRMVGVADQSHVLAFEERAIAGRAIGDAFAKILILPGNSELLIFDPGGDDDGFAGVFLHVGTDLKPV